MSVNLLPQDVYLLSVRWFDLSHVPKRASMPPLHLRNYYVSKLTESVASWIAGGLLAWQFPLQRRYAFLPLEWQIGTMREQDSYLDALAELPIELNGHEDPLLPRECEHTIDAFGPVGLGTIYARGAALALPELAHRAAAPSVEQTQTLSALRHGLELVERIQPDKVLMPLVRAWNLLFGGAAGPRGSLQVDARKVLDLKHAFLLALFHEMHVGQDREALHFVLEDFRAEVAAAGWPPELDLFLQRCENRLGNRDEEREEEEQEEEEEQDVDQYVEEDAQRGQEPDGRRPAPPLPQPATPPVAAAGWKKPASWEVALPPHPGMEQEGVS